MSASPNTPYRKVRGGGLTWKGRGRLWLAQDHLLEVTSVFVVESYRRFFFQDIRALVIQRTNVRRVWAWLLGVVGVIAGLLAGSIGWQAYSNPSEEWHVALYFPAGFFGLIALVCAALWIVNLALGPSCVCQVLTPTGWHALTGLRRLSPATRAQDEIAGIIQTVQGLPPSATPPPAPAATS